MEPKTGFAAASKRRLGHSAKCGWSKATACTVATASLQSGCGKLRTANQLETTLRKEQYGSFSKKWTATQSGSQESTAMNNGRKKEEIGRQNEDGVGKKNGGRRRVELGGRTVLFSCEEEASDHL